MLKALPDSVKAKLGVYNASGMGSRAVSINPPPNKTPFTIREVWHALMNLDINCKNHLEKVYNNYAKIVQYKFIQIPLI